MTLSPDVRLGWALLAWTGAAAASAVWPGGSSLLVLALAVGVLVAIGDALGLWLRAPLVLSRRWPERLLEGRPAETFLHVHNPGKTPCRAEVADEWPDDLCGEDGEPHWSDVAIAAGETRVLSHTALPARRGDRPLGHAAALCRSSLGLWRRRALLAEPAIARVQPDASRFLRPEALDPRAVLASLGVKPARRRGEGLDFESLRDYVPGDDPRRIDWRATARRGRAVVRQFQHERNHSVHIAVDAGRLMGSRHAGRSKLDHAVDGALALVYAALAAGDRVGVSVFDRRVRARVAPRRRRADLGLFVDALAPIEASLTEPDYRALTRALLVEHRKRSLVVVLTDFVEADTEVLVPPLALLARHHRVLLVAIRDHSFDELDRARGGAREPREGPYRRLVLGDLLREREEVLARLRARGLHTLDLRPESIVASVLNRYLALRYGAPA